VVHLYPTNKEVNERNIECLQRNGNSIVRIDALHTGADKRTTSQQARNLDSKAYLCRDAFVLLTQNIWQSVGLCNGATGKVIDFIFSKEGPPPGLPEYNIVDFGANYTGPPIFGEDTYTAFSRVRRASDIGIVDGFLRDRLLTIIAKQAKMKPRIKEERRLDDLAKKMISWLRCNSTMDG